MSANLQARVLTVALDGEYRDEHLEKIMDAIRMTKGVLKVKAHEDKNHTEWMALETARRELGQKLWEILYPTKQ